eukprot:8302-Heterococcus_DN1.PRE.1
MAALAFLCDHCMTAGWCDIRVRAHTRSSAALSTNAYSEITSELVDTLDQQKHQVSMRTGVILVIYIYITSLHALSARVAYSKQSHLSTLLSAYVQCRTSGLCVCQLVEQYNPEKQFVVCGAIQVSKKHLVMCADCFLGADCREPPAVPEGSNYAPCGRERHCAAYDCAATDNLK